MSPELFLHDDVSPALDVYSFGIIGECPAHAVSSLSGAVRLCMNQMLRQRCWVAIVALACCAITCAPLPPPCSPCRAVHIMCTGRDPYQDMAAPMIILAKVCPLGSKSPAACPFTLQLGSLELLLCGQLG